MLKRCAISLACHTTQAPGAGVSTCDRRQQAPAASSDDVGGSSSGADYALEQLRSRDCCFCCRLVLRLLLQWLLLQWLLRRVIVMQVARVRASLASLFCCVALFVIRRHATERCAVDVETQAAFPLRQHSSKDIECIVDCDGCMTL